MSSCTEPRIGRPLLYGQSVSTNRCRLCLFRCCRRIQNRSWISKPHSFRPSIQSALTTAWITRSRQLFHWWTRMPPGQIGFSGKLVCANDNEKEPRIMRLAAIISLSLVTSLVNAQLAVLHDSREKHLANVRQLTFGGDNAECYWSFG